MQVDQDFKKQQVVANPRKSYFKLAKQYHPDCWLAVFHGS